MKRIGRKLKGHFGYYRITGNYDARVRDRREVIRVWRPWLARRGESHGMSWARMHHLLQSWYLPRARVMHAVSAANP
jgi:hypothetical protein